MWSCLPEDRTGAPMSPAHVPRSRGRGRKSACLICGQDRECEDAHFPTPAEFGGKKTIPLCPTHHRLLDHGRIRREEAERIWERAFRKMASTVEEFVEWAHQQGYPYSVSDLKRKFWDAPPP